MARKVIVKENPKSVIAEQYRTIRTNINFSMPDKDFKTILVTSAGPSEGKSTTAANIAGGFFWRGQANYFSRCGYAKTYIPPYI